LIDDIPRGGMMPNELSIFGHQRVSCHLGNDRCGCDRGTARVTFQQLPFAGVDSLLFGACRLLMCEPELGSGSLPRGGGLPSPPNKRYPVNLFHLRPPYFDSDSAFANHHIKSVAALRGEQLGVG
jgi:hypothetical protein